MDENTRMIERVARIVAAYVSRNLISPADLPELIRSAHATLNTMNGAGPGAVIFAGDQKPAVSVRKSISDEWLICLEDGKKFKSLKRHLKSAFNLTPEQYRQKWGLPSDYPMVAPAYSARRSNLAKEMGLGRVAGETVAKLRKGRRKKGD